MSGTIYLVQNDESLVALQEKQYASEDLLQSLLAKYPNLLAGDQMNENAPRRWLLVSREYGVPDHEEGAGRWSLDHLFLDQDSIPTLVEVKRSTDTRTRREVVAQMLDYAANAVVYWPVEAMRAKLEAACQAQGENVDAVIAQLVEADPDEEASVEAFWNQVKTNLQAGKIRMVFVADEIPAELRRIVEFLNEQMDPAEVLAVEVKQYVGEGLRTLVPRVVGQTAGAQQKKGTPTRQGQPWDETRFFSDLEAKYGPVSEGVARKIYGWAEDYGLRVKWGRGKQDGSCYFLLDHGGITYCPISLWTYDRVVVEFLGLQYQPPFDEEAKRLELLERLNRLSHVNLPREVTGNKRPGIHYKDLAEEDDLRRFLETLDWFFKEVKK